MSLTFLMGLLVLVFVWVPVLSICALTILMVGLVYLYGVWKMCCFFMNSCSTLWARIAREIGRSND